jgi:5-formyltetrahydrofolate cyclo-ligase
MYRWQRHVWHASGLEVGRACRGARPLCVNDQIFNRAFFRQKFFSPSLPAALGFMQSAVLEETRNGLRNAMMKRRSALSPATCLSWSGSIQTKVLELPQYLAARSVAVYSAIRNEVATRAIMDDALGRGKKVFCPKLSGADPLFVRVSSETDLLPGPSGAAEPAEDVRLADADCEGLMVIVPGVVFDHCGNRLGRGGGWYDRALQWFDDRGVFIGLAYEFQVVDRVPAELWDQKVHYVITESRVIDCGVLPRRCIAR